MYLRLINNLETGDSVQRSIEVMSCTKDINGNILGCTAENPPLRGLQSVRCNLEKPYPGGNIKITSPGNLSNQSKVAHVSELHSDVFTCRGSDGAQLLKNVFLLVETRENIAESRVEEKNIESITCVSDIKQGKIVACSLQRVT
jgi:hypothetical protein